jgi:hypothetical protein
MAVARLMASAAFDHSGTMPAWSIAARNCCSGVASWVAEADTDGLGEVELDDEAEVVDADAASSPLVEQPVIARTAAIGSKPTRRVIA